MKIAVCDDSREERAAVIPMLSEYFADKGSKTEFAEYVSGEALLAAFAPGVFSMIFLDIYMDGITGIETAKNLRIIDPDCVIIFTTTSHEHGAEAFDVEAFHYLVKPIDRKKLFTVLDKWYDRFCEAKTIELKCGRVTRSVYIKDILYIDVMGRNCTVHTAAGSMEVSMSLASIEAMLPQGQYCRPIRYCLAAMRHVQTIKDDEVILDDGEKLPLSRLEKENLRQQLASYRLRALRGR